MLAGFKVGASRFAVSPADPHLKSFPCPLAKLAILHLPEFVAERSETVFMQLKNIEFSFRQWFHFTVKYLQEFFTFYFDANHSP
jgi:hypothetical protein